MWMLSLDHGSFTRMAPACSQVRSRFVTSDGKEDYASFCDAMSSLGLKRMKLKKPSELFVVMMFRKTSCANAEEVESWPILKRCVYKRR